MGLNPTILRQVRALVLAFSPSEPAAVPRRGYRASGLVHAQMAAVPRRLGERAISTLCRPSSLIPEWWECGEGLALEYATVEERRDAHDVVLAPVRIAARPTNERSAGGPSQRCFTLVQPLHQPLGLIIPSTVRHERGLMN